MTASSGKPIVLIVDDEADIHAVTRLTLKSMRYKGEKIELMNAMSGKEAIEIVESHENIAVILLDVVMETSTAGLDSCREIRDRLENHLVRILLRTGQPGAAPEKKVIEEYDIDGYLPKAEMTTTRLYSSIRTALKAYQELVELERYREVLVFLHNSVAELHSFDSLETILGRVLSIAVGIVPSGIAVLNMQTVEEDGSSNQHFEFLSTDEDQASAGRLAQEIQDRIMKDPAAQSLREIGPFGEGFLIPINIHRELGHGWVYLEGQPPDDIAMQALPVLAAHASNSLYSNISEKILREREGDLFGSVSV